MLGQDFMAMMLLVKSGAQQQPTVKPVLKTGE